MRIADLSRIPYVHNSVQKVSFRSEETFLDFDALLWDPSRIINEYFSNTQQMRRKSEGIILEQEVFTRVANDIQRRNNEISKMLELGRTIYIMTPAPLLCYIPNGQIVNMLEYEGVS